MSRRPAVFLDRDGTLIVERHFLDDPAGVEFLPGALEALRRLQDRGYALVLVTNQSGIGRGLYTVAAFEAVQARIEDGLRAAGVRLDGVYWCPHAPEQACECRKPGLALFRRAAEDLGLDLAASAFVGDRLRDVQPGELLGGRAILVRTGYGRSDEPSASPDVEVVADLAEAATRLLEG